MTSCCLLIATVISAVPAEGLPAAPVTAIAFAPEGNSVLVGTPHEVAELSWPQLKLLRKLPADIGHIHDLEFAPGGNELAIAGGRPAQFGRCVSVSWPAGKRQRTIDAGADVAYRAAWYPAGDKLALASADGSVYIVPSAGGAAVQLQEHSAAVLAALVMADEERPLLLSAGRDQTIRVWNAQGPDRSLRTLDNHTSAVVDLALRPTRQGEPPMFASAGADRTVRFWQPKTGRLVRFSRLPSPPLALCWTGSGEQVAVACQDGKLRIVEMQTAKILAEHDAVEGWAYNVALAPDGKTVLIGGEGGQIAKVPLP